MRENYRESSVTGI